MKLTRGFAAVGLVTASLLVHVLAGQDTRSAGPPRGPEEQPVRVVPIVVVQAGLPAAVDVALENKSQQVVRYLADAGKAYQLNLILTENGVAQVARGPSRLIAITKEGVKDLKPGDRLVQRLDLHERYPDLRPGLYALDAEMYTGNQEFGITPIRLRERVLYLRVEAHPTPAGGGATSRSAGR